MKKKYSGAANRELNAKAEKSVTYKKEMDSTPTSDKNDGFLDKDKFKTIEEAEKEFNKNLMGGRKGFEPDEEREDEKLRARGIGIDLVKDPEQRAKDEKLMRDAKLINLSGKRIGRLYFAVETIFNRPEDVAFILSMIGFVPFRAECKMYMEQFEYIGLCGQFDRIPDAGEAPIYEITVEQNGKIINVNRTKAGTIPMSGRH